MENNPPNTNQALPSQPVPPPKKSFLSGKLIILIVILIVVLFVGGTYLALNSKPKPTPTVLKITPTSAPTPTPDPTASWKTFNNSFFSFKYPSDWKIILDSSGKYGGLVATQNCDEGSVTHISTCSIIDFGQAGGDSSGNTPGLAKKKIGVTNFYEITKTQGDGVVQTSDFFTIQEAWFVFALSQKGDVSRSDIYNKILSTLKFAEASQATDTSTWKTYTNAKYNYSIKYPKDHNVISGVEGLPGNEDLTKIETTAVVIIGQPPVYDLQITAVNEFKSLENVKGELLENKVLQVTNMSDTTINGLPAIKYDLHGNPNITVLRNNIRYDLAPSLGKDADYKEITTQILSTFKFTQ